MNKLIYICLCIMVVGCGEVGSGFTKYKKILLDGTTEVDEEQMAIYDEYNKKKLKALFKEINYTKEDVKRDFSEIKYYHSNEYRNKNMVYSKDICYYSIFPVPIGPFDYTVLKQAIQEGKERGKIEQDVIGFVDASISFRNIAIIPIIEQCKGISGIPVTKEELERLEKQGAIYKWNE